MFDKIVFGAGVVCAAAGFICAGWALYLQSCFLVEGSSGTQEFLIGAFGTNIFGAVPSTAAGIVTYAIRPDISQRSAIVMCAPAVLNALLLATGYLLNHLAYL